MADTRLHNTKRNIVTGIAYRLCAIVMPFVLRSAILYLLGEQYVGLSGLFTSILEVLNLAELGFSVAVIYHMYRPLAEGDTDTVCALLAYYRRIYRLIGSVIMLVGLSLTPLLPKLIKGSWPAEINIYVLYVLALIGTSSSYFLYAYKSALLNATQRLDLTNVIYMSVQLGQYILQLTVLLLWKNYYAFTVISVFAGIAANLLTERVSKKHYPQYTCRGSVSEELRVGVRQQVEGVMIGKLSDASRNGFDNIVLSALFGLTTVAIYSNYYMIYAALYGIMCTIVRAMQASVGNSIATESKEKNYTDLRKFQFLFGWINCFTTVSLFCLYQPFMLFWTKKEELLLPTGDMLLFCVYYFAINMNNTRNLYFEGGGYWNVGKLSFAAEAIANLVLNVVLGKLWGTTGVLLATILTIVVFNFFTRTELLFHHYFQMPSAEFYRDHALYTVVTAVAGVTTWLLCDLVSAGGFAEIAERAVICVVIPNLMWLISFCKTERFRTAKHFVMQLAHKR